MDSAASGDKPKSTSKQIRHNFSEYRVSSDLKTYGSSYFPLEKTRPTKKLVIINFREEPKVQDDYATKNLPKLKEAVKAIQLGQPVATPLEELYRSVENMCSMKLASQLYDILKDIIKTHLEEVVAPFIQGIQDRRPFLKEMKRCWEEHCQQMIMIRSIFLYLDRRSLLQTYCLSSVWKMGLELFRCSVLGAQIVQKLTVDGVLMLIKKERDGNIKERELLISLLKMLSDLQIYHDIFEYRFLKGTDVTFTLRYEFLLNDEQRLDSEEDRRVPLCLKKSTC